MGEGAKDALMTLWRSDDERMRARALWLLGKIEISDDDKIALAREALQDPSADIRVLAFRVVPSTSGQVRRRRHLRRDRFAGSESGRPT